MAARPIARDGPLLISSAPGLLPAGRSRPRVKDLMLDHVFASAAESAGGQHDARASCSLRWLSRQLPPTPRRGSTKSAAQVAGLRQGRGSVSRREPGHAQGRQGRPRAERCRPARSESTRPGWNPRAWSADQAARVSLVLALEAILALSRAASISFATPPMSANWSAFYRGLPLYPDQPRYLARATEGLRTNMKDVFEAIAHRNPYPSEQFPEAAWNQMVLKALFVGSALWPIVGLDKRSNPSSRACCATMRMNAGRPAGP